MTSPANSAVTCLNKGDLYALFGPESQRYRHLERGRPLLAQAGRWEGPGFFPDVPLKDHGSREESGTYDAFIEARRHRRHGPRSRACRRTRPLHLRTDYQSSPSDNVIIQAMEGSESSLGFVGFAFADQAGDQVKEIEVDGGSGCVAPKRRRRLPMRPTRSRVRLYIYVNTDKVATNPTLAAFVPSDDVSDAGDHGGHGRRLRGDPGRATGRDTPGVDPSWGNAT